MGVVVVQKRRIDSVEVQGEDDVHSILVDDDADEMHGQRSADAYSTILDSQHDTTRRLETSKFPKELITATLDASAKGCRRRDGYKTCDISGHRHSVVPPTSRPRPTEQGTICGLD